jgi:hypothetical protein
MNKILERTTEDGLDTIIIRMDAGSIELIYRDDALWIDVNGRPACQIDLYHLTNESEDAEKYAQVVLEGKDGKDPVGYHRLLKDGNLTTFEFGVKEKRIEMDNAKYYGY